MNAWKRRSVVIPAAVGLLGLPLLFCFTGDVPRRTPLKDSFTILTIVSFCLMLGQFYLARVNDIAVRTLGLGAAMRYHEIIGYVFAGVLLAHPILVVVPRFLEPGVDPLDAFITMVTRFESTGILLGIAAWGLLVALLITSLVRRRLPLTYRAWRILHGVLATVFVALATWHAIDLGRHTDLVLSIDFIAVALGGVALLVRGYIAGAADSRRQAHD